MITNQKKLNLLRKIIKEEINKIRKPLKEGIDVKSMLNSYLETLIWQASEDEDGNNLDSFTIHDFSPSALSKCKKDVDSFLKLAKSYLPSDVDYKQVGHDFALSRNGHGAGFFDADYLEDDQRQILQKIARKFGEVNVYGGNDGIDID